MSRVSPTNPFVQFESKELEQSISDRFEKQVRRHPRRLAIKTRHHQLTYEELNKLANRVAHTLLVEDRESEQAVALLFDQGAPMIAASLGVLKAGKFFAPLDNSLPQKRLGGIVQDIQPKLIVTDNENMPAALELAHGLSKVLNIDNLKSNVPDNNPSLSVSPEQLAYIHYTSGSTGEPKGVVQNHRNELHNIMTNTNALHIMAEDRISLVRSNNVGATRDSLAALLNGAAIISLNLKKEGLENIAEWLIAEEISVYTCVTTVFRYSLNTLSGDVRFPSVRIIHVGGEPVYRTDAELYKKHFSRECLFVSRLGVSETETLTYYFVKKETEIEGEVVPVGYELEGNDILLLDDDRREVDLGQVGEIAVRSQYLAVGYWRQPELTRASFVPDPKGKNHRLYLTGDLGYKLPDGCLVHVGRKDTQVKVRGHRVETSEVETTLLEIPTIKQAVVVLRQNSSDKLLVAYVVPQHGETLTIARLRDGLKKKLPSYMVPSAFLILEKLPTTSSGKVDRQALPPPGRSRCAIESIYVAPRTPVERVIVKLCSEIIEVDALGINDDIWELGSNSLIAAQIGARLNATFGFQLPANLLFTASTPAEVAEWLVQNEPHRGQTEKIAKLFLKIEDMSAEDIGAAIKGARGNG